jgi:hypothetical protein
MKMGIDFTMRDMVAEQGFDQMCTGNFNDISAKMGHPANSGYWAGISLSTTVIHCHYNHHNSPIFRRL